MVHTTYAYVHLITKSHAQKFCGFLFYFAFGEHLRQDFPTDLSLSSNCLYSQDYPPTYLHYKYESLCPAKPYHLFLLLILCASTFKISKSSPLLLLFCNCLCVFVGVFRPTEMEKESFTITFSCLFSLYLFSSASAYLSVFVYALLFSVASV